ncbi:MAG TPA: YcaO-like family protein, partial [Streptomyces sp.]
MRLTYLEVNPLGEGSCSVVTSTDRSFTVPLPLADAITLIEGLEDTEPENTEAAPGAPVRPAGPSADLARNVRLMLAEGNSLLAERGSAARQGTRLPLFALTGNTALAGQLLRHAPEPDGATAETAADSARPEIPLLITGTGLDDPAFAAAVRDADEAGRGWLPLLMERGRFWLGPLLGGGSHLAYSDFRDRLLTNLPPGRTRTGTVALGRWAQPAAADLTWVMACVAGMLGRLREGFPVAAENHQVELDPSTVTTRHHLVLPFPDAEGAERPSVAPGTHTPEDLIDPRTGVLTEVTRVEYPSCIPSGLITMHAHVAKIPRVREWQTDPVAAGTSFVSEIEARQAAIGEAVERYAANVVQPHMIREATWDELRAAGEYAVDPDTLVLFSDEQYAAPGFPFTPFSRDLRTYWVRGRSLTRDRPAWLPAPLVYPNWKSTHYSGDLVTNNTFYPGVAAGPNPDFAMASGLEEVIERHATMAWWSHAQALPSAEVPPHLAAALGQAP